MFFIAMKFYLKTNFFASVLAFVQVNYIVGEVCLARTECKCTTDKVAYNTSTAANPESFIKELANETDICNPLKSKNLNRTITGLQLICSFVQITNTSDVSIFNNASDNNSTFSLVLNYPCAAPSPPPVKHYSTGTILTVIFCTFLLGYYVLGISVRYFMIGARGIEVIPHVDFWKDLPSLIKDGAQFLQNGCKITSNNTSTPDGYDAI